MRWLRTAVWIEANDANRIAALKNTTRPMSLLNPGFAPTLLDGDAVEPTTMYGLQTTTACNLVLGDELQLCPARQTCGTDHRCYRPALETVRLGFTNSQRTTAQDVHINDFFTSYVPFPP